jgi:hypothetical protein
LAILADVAELLDEPGQARRHLRVGAGRLGLLPDLTPWTVHERRGRVVLLKADRAHLPSLLGLASAAGS